MNAINEITLLVYITGIPTPLPLPTLSLTAFSKTRETNCKMRSGRNRIFFSLHCFSHNWSKTHSFVQKYFTICVEFNFGKIKNISTTTVS